MRWGLAIVWFAGCGRIGFGSIGDRDGGDSSGGDVATMTDAPECVDNDGVCLPPCIGMDTDCVMVCGDGICAGNVGETCPTCMADCAKMTAVCGNGACDPGEDSASCLTDCGPSPWPWDSEDMAMFAEINDARTGGVKCPGDAGLRFAPALPSNATVQQGARQYAWDIVHTGFVTGNGSRCNGATFGEAQAPYGGNGGVAAVAASTTQAVGFWTADAALCPIVMSTTVSSMGAGAAHDGASNAFVVWFH